MLHNKCSRMSVHRTFRIKFKRMRFIIFGAALYLCACLYFFFTYLAWITELGCLYNNFGYVDTNLLAIRTFIQGNWKLFSDFVELVIYRKGSITYTTIRITKLLIIIFFLFNYNNNNWYSRWLDTYIQGFQDKI